MSKWEYTEQELWRFGVNGDAIFHVFSTVAVGQTVLVFAEARRGDGTDNQCPHDIRMRKSVDGGRTFDEQRCVVPSYEAHIYLNGTALYDAEIGRLFLFYSENIEKLRAEMYLIYSDDLGETWSEPRYMTPVFDGTDAPSFNIAGPGHGIQLKHGPHKGRLLMQCWHRNAYRKYPDIERVLCTHLIYSDDHGASWQPIDCMGYEHQTNESRLVETKNGLFWHFRTNSTYTLSCRSMDDGLTWSPMEKLELPPRRKCDVGAIGLAAPKKGYEDMVLLSRVGDEEKRINMEIRISYDGGESFPDVFYLMQGDAMPGYSDMCIIEEEEPVIGLLHCRHNHVFFSRISLQTLTGGKYENTTRNCWLQ